MMEQTPQELGWQPLSLLARQFRANVTALRTRDPQLADRLAALMPAKRYIKAEGDIVRVATEAGDGLSVMANPVPAHRARRLAEQLCPTHRYTRPLLVAGLDQGWLWQTLYTMPIASPALPGHRPPLYLATTEIERLWTAMHLHDWRTMLADQRVRLFVGADAFEQMRAGILSHERVPWPRVAVTIEPAFWPSGESIDTLVQTVQQRFGERLGAARRQAEAAYAWASAPAIAQRLRGSQPLRILGITSRYTTFLQYSMRDWLEACARLGHQTRMLIEQADHETMNNVVYSQAIAEFKPDLVLLIDHYRAELAAVPESVPCVMWIQDKLPNIFDRKAGAAQTERDYVLGFGRQECVDEFGYPAERFMPTRIGVNAGRFAPRPLDAAERERFTCDIAYVSNAGTPAETIVAEAIEQNPAPDVRRLLRDIFDRLQAIYRADGCITEVADMRDLLQTAMDDCRMRMADPTPLLDLFFHRVNNALFRHQALEWLSGMDVDLRIYGKGWETHPKFKRFARGVADNQRDLSAVYQASRINLQIIPHGAVHQRLCDGLSAGGFFLMRYCPGDEVEEVYRPIWDWCVQSGVKTDADLLDRATSEIHQLLTRLRALKGRDPFSLGVPLVTSMAVAAEGGYTCSASSIWPEYPRVSFRTGEELREKVAYFLSQPQERAQITASMRQTVLDRLTYTAITRKLLAMIGDDLARRGTTTTSQAAA